MDLCGYDMCQKRGRESLHGCSAVGDMVRILICSRVPSFFVPCWHKGKFICPRGEFKLVNWLIFLSAETKLCRLARHCPQSKKGIGANVGVCTVAGIGGLKNVAKRNVKPDQLRLVARDKCK